MPIIEITMMMIADIRADRQQVRSRGRADGQAGADDQMDKPMRPGPVEVWMKATAISTGMKVPRS